jgi:hypothetical protein
MLHTSFLVIHLCTTADAFLGGSDSRGCSGSRRCCGRIGTQGVGSIGTLCDILRRTLFGGLDVMLQRTGRTTRFLVVVQAYRAGLQGRLKSVPGPYILRHADGVLHGLGGVVARHQVLPVRCCYSSHPRHG